VRQGGIVSGIHCENLCYISQRLVKFADIMEAISKEHAGHFKGLVRSVALFGFQGGKSCGPCRLP